jgi:hypothetical protein
LGTTIRIRWTKAQGSIEQNLVATPGEATDFAMEQSPEVERPREATWKFVLARTEGKRKAEATARGQRPRRRGAAVAEGKASEGVSAIWEGERQQRLLREPGQRRAGNVANPMAGSGVQ